jgi:hypothetical protein
VEARRRLHKMMTKPCVVVTMLVACPQLYVGHILRSLFNEFPEKLIKFSVLLQTYSPANLLF